MPSSESLPQAEPQAEPEPTNPKLPPLARGELATRLRLIPPVVPVADGRKPKPFFAACAATPCNSIAEKAVFMAYAALSGKTGATWKVKGERAHFYARQAKVATTAGCTARTVYKMTLRLMQAGRLLRVLSGRGRIPHVFVVVPDGWYSQSRPEPRSDLNLVDRNHVPINRAFSKRRSQTATRLEEETPSQGVNPAEGPVTQPSPAMKAAPSAPYQVEQKNHDPTRKLVLLATPSQAQRHVEAMREIAQRAERPISKANPPQKRGPRPDNYVPSGDKIPKLRDMRAVHSKANQPKSPPGRSVAQDDGSIEPSETDSNSAICAISEQRAAALAMFAEVDAGIDEAAKREAPIARTGGGLIGGGYTGGTPDTCPRCGYDRIYAGGCESCGADLRDFGDDFNHGH